uniref:Sorting nexin-14 (inferred by orthology to a human protein) n=1 Tax=Nippostrongylus brasiliensis TaxID=27835 RepID=A0A0N4YFY1_NIPBR
LEVPVLVNDALESLLDQVIDEYVNNWYESGISRDRDFLNEVRYQIRFACSRGLQRALALDLPSLVAEEVFPTVALHIHRIMETQDELAEKMYPRSLVESHICEKLADLHFCMGSRKNELDYLRQVADFLITKLVDDTRLAGRAHDDDSPSRVAGKVNMSAWPSQSARHFLRELVVNAILLPCLDLIADPDTINHLLILAFDAQKNSCDRALNLGDSCKQVNLLTNFTEPTQTLPDSLLQLKLSEVLRDARQYSMFRLYLQDTRGPVHELGFLAEASRIHDSMQRKSESSAQIAYDIWQLFGQFVHDSAPEKIEFDEEIVREFKAAVECNNLLLLDKVIEKSYQIVYQRMQADHVIPFCQSDSFLGYLCGSPPISVNELIDQRSVRRKSAVSTGAFSLAQFRSRLRRVITGASSDGSLETEDSLSSSFVDVGDTDKFENVKEMEGQDEEEVSSTSAVEAPNSESVLVIDKETRNINQWKVNITKIVPMRDCSTGRTLYVYVIDVERKEAKDKETKCWSIYRRFSEFYVLEMKLLEFHGDSLRFTLLPPRKTLVTRNRAFLEQHRLLFSMFLSSLCKQNMLQRSDLLFAFLTSSDEFRHNLLLSDLNPWKVVKKMPGKLSREKGQHLRPFLLTILANTLFTPEKIEFREKFAASDSRILCRNTVDNLMLQLLRKAYWAVFSEVNLVTIIQLIQTAVFCSDSSLPSDQEKSLREELAIRRALEFAQDEMPSYVLRALDSRCWRDGVKRLVNTLQYPRLNKHLSYLLLDQLITKLFPDDFP